MRRRGWKRSSRCSCRSLAPGVPYHEDNIRRLGIEGVGELPGVAVLPEEVAVVGDDYEQGILHYPEFVVPSR